MFSIPSARPQQSVIYFLSLVFPFWNILYKWNHMWHFPSGFSLYMFLRFVHVVSVHFLSWVVLHCVCLSIYYWLMEIWVISILGLLWTKLLQILVYMFSVDFFSSYEPRDYGKFIFKEIAKPLSSFFISSPIFVVACFSGLVMLVGGKSNLSCSLHFSKD